MGVRGKIEARRERTRSSSAVGRVVHTRRPQPGGLSPTTSTTQDKRFEIEGVLEGDEEDCFSHMFVGDARYIISDIRNLYRARGWGGGE